MKKEKLNLVIVAVSLVFLVVYVFAVDGLDGFSKALAAADPFQLCLAAVPMLVYWLLEASILHVAVKRFFRSQPFFRTLQTSMIGQLFNCITPFASGGQPIQAYHMVRGGVPTGAAACALTVKFIVYQFVLTAYSFFTLLFKFREFSKEIKNLKYLVLAGFALNTAVILALLAVCFCRGGTVRFLSWCLALAHRMHIVRDTKRCRAAMEKEIDLFYSSFSAIRGEWRLLFRMGALSALQLTAYFMIPYLLLRCFPVSQTPFFSMLVATAFVLNVSSFVPLPGAAGGAELSFHTLFAMFFPPDYLPISILLWRVITFYLPIVVGAAFSLEGKGHEKMLKAS